MRLRLIGLGPGGDLPAAAIEACRSAHAVLVRTEIHPGVEQLRAHGIAFETADDLYQSAAGFDDLYPRIAERVLSLLEHHRDVAYAVPGHPLFGERSCRLLIAECRSRGIDVAIVGGKDFVTATLEAVGEPFSGHLQILNAYEVASFRPDPRAPCLIYQLDSKEAASEAKLALMKAFPDEHPVRLVIDGASAAERVVETPLYELDHLDFNPRCSLYVPALDLARPPGFYGLVEVVSRLRGPGGCPWDIEQTHETLKTHLVEESYEVLEAIDADDPGKLCEELGDFLLQALMHAQIDSEEGLYDIDDVIAGQTEKLVRRHPHVFADLSVDGVDEVLKNWDRIKSHEKGGEPASALAGVPKSLPSLLRAFEVSKRAARLGFDWPSLESVLEKVEEELAEVRSAPPDRLAAEIGDLLFAAANVARKAGVEPEEALRQMVHRFTSRFTYMEQQLAGRDPHALTADEWETLWQEAKKAAGG